MIGWFDAIKSDYDTYAKDIATYDADRTKWDKGELGAKPWVPEQPAAGPDLLDQLKAAGDSNKNKASITDLGYGAVSQFSIDWTALNTNAGHYFGTLAGKSTLKSATKDDISTSAKKGWHWVSNSGKTGTDCDPAYVMVSSYLKTPGSDASAKPLKVIVTEAEW